MPIRINLLAEAQAAEELRRRDPVKRAVWCGGFCFALMLCWGLSLQLRIMRNQSELASSEADWQRLEKDYKEVKASSQTALEIRTRLQNLEELSQQRFLWANVLDALQRVAVSNVSLARVRTSQEYVITEPVLARTNASGVVIPGKPATSREKIVMVLDARDHGAKDDGNYQKFVDALTATEYFRSALQKTNGVNLKQLLPNQTAGAESGSSYTLFTLECLFPEKVR